MEDFLFSLVIIPKKGESYVIHVSINHMLWEFIERSVQFSCSVMSNSLQPHEPQHARPPCPSPTPRVHPNPCPLCQWCHPTISSSVIPFSSCPQSFPASGSFQMSLYIYIYIYLTHPYILITAGKVLHFPMYCFSDISQILMWSAFLVLKQIARHFWLLDM